MVLATTVGGIDPSSRRIVIVESRISNKKKGFIHSCYLTHERIEDNQLEAFDFIVDFAMGVRDREGRSPRLYLEQPVMGVGGPGATIPQAYVDGSIMAAAAQTECYITLINNSTWKKRVLGNGNINKNGIVEKMHEVWPEFMEKVPKAPNKQFADQKPGAPDQDVVDAGAINLFGWSNVEMIEAINRRRAKKR